MSRRGARTHRGLAAAPSTQGTRILLGTQRDTRGFGVETVKAATGVFRFLPCEDYPAPGGISSLQHPARTDGKRKNQALGWGHQSQQAASTSTSHHPLPQTSSKWRLSEGLQRCTWLHDSYQQPISPPPSSGQASQRTASRQGTARVRRRLWPSSRHNQTASSNQFGSRRHPARAGGRADPDSRCVSSAQGISHHCLLPTHSQPGTQERTAQHQHQHLPNLPTPGRAPRESTQGHGTGCRHDVHEQDLLQLQARPPQPEDFTCNSSGT